MTGVAGHPPAKGDITMHAANGHAAVPSRPFLRRLLIRSWSGRHPCLSMIVRAHIMTQDGAPGRVRRRCRLLAGAVCGALVLAVAAAGCSSAPPHAGAQASRPGEAAGLAWVCRPGQAANPCASNLAATTVTAGGTLQPAVLAALAGGIEVRLLLRPRVGRAHRDRQHQPGRDQGGPRSGGRTSRPLLPGLPGLGTVLPLADPSDRGEGTGRRRGPAAIDLRRCLRQRASRLAMVPRPQRRQAGHPDR